MLSIYENIEDFKTFCQKMHLDLYSEEKTYEQLLIDYNVLILNDEKYNVDDLNKYIDFYKYKPIQKNKKLSIINNFNNIDIKLQNKLLKLFEDSEENHILVTNNISKILPTIRSRAINIKNKNEVKQIKNYPNRYNEVLNLFNYEEDEVLTDKYLKFYDFLIKQKYKDAYLLLSLLKEYDEQVIYEIIQLSHSKIGYLNIILELQKRLVTKTNKKMQIENYLLQMIGLNNENN